jgi:hypothetical protein
MMESPIPADQTQPRLALAIFTIQVGIGIPHCDCSRSICNGSLRGIVLLAVEAVVCVFWRGLCAACVRVAHPAFTRRLSCITSSCVRPCEMLITAQDLPSDLLRSPQWRSRLCALATGEGPFAEVPILRFNLLTNSYRLVSRRLRCCVSIHAVRIASLLRFCLRVWLFVRGLVIPLHSPHSLRSRFSLPPSFAAHCVFPLPAAHTMHRTSPTRCPTWTPWRRRRRAASSRPRHWHR